MIDRRMKRQQILDPAVADLLAGMEQRQSEAALPRKERERRARERAKIQSRKEQRATYDLPPALRHRIKELAEAERVPASQLVTLALIRFLKDLKNGAVDIDGYKQPSRSPRYDWNLKLAEEE